MHMVSAARLCIPVLWKSARRPYLREWFCRINRTREMKELLHVTKETSHKCYSIWATWLHFAESSVYKSCLEDIPCWVRRDPDQVIWWGPRTLDLSPLLPPLFSISLTAQHFPTTHLPQTQPADLGIDASYLIYMFCLSPLPCPLVFIRGPRPIQYVKEVFLASDGFFCIVFVINIIIIDCKVIGFVPVYDAEVITCYRHYLVLLTFELLFYVMCVYYMFENK